MIIILLLKVQYYHTIQILCIIGINIQVSSRSSLCAAFTWQSVPESILKSTLTLPLKKPSPDIPAVVEAVRIPGTGRAAAFEEGHQAPGRGRGRGPGGGGRPPDTGRNIVEAALRPRR